EFSDGHQSLPLSAVTVAAVRSKAARTLSLLNPTSSALCTSAAFVMVEVLAAALTGGRFGFQDRSADYPGAQTSNAGQFVLLIDPTPSAGTGFATRVEALLDALREAGAGRLPGESRQAHRAAC